MSAATIVAASTNTVCLSLLRLRSKHSNGSGTPMYTAAAASLPLRQSLWHLRASLSVGLFSTSRIPPNCSGF